MSGRMSYNFFTAFNSFFNSQVSVMQKKRKGRAAKIHQLSSIVENLRSKPSQAFSFFLLSYNKLVG